MMTLSAILNWAQLLISAQSKKKLLSEFELKELIVAGLFNKNQNSKLFFMNRIMVPIINLQKI